TTILDASIDGGQIGDLYERRWDGEVDIRAIKSTMKMDVLRCKTPEMVRQTIPLREADVWIHPNVPGFRDQLANRAPFRLELPGGIAVWPAALPGARRLPLLGVAGLRRADLQVFLDCHKCQVW